MDITVRHETDMGLASSSIFAAHTLNIYSKGSVVTHRGPTVRPVTGKGLAGSSKFATHTLYNDDIQL